MGGPYYAYIRLPKLFEASQNLRAEMVSRAGMIRTLAVPDNDADLAPFRLRRAGNEQLEHRAGPEPCSSEARGPERRIGHVLTAPSWPTHAQRLATAIEEEVTAMPNAPDCGQRVMIE